MEQNAKKKMEFLLSQLRVDVTDNHKATLEGRRLMAVLFNRALRQEVLGF